MNYRSVIYDDKLKHWKLLLYFHLQVHILLLKLTFNFKVFPLLLWLKLKLWQIIFSSIPLYVSFFSALPLKAARGFSFCRVCPMFSREISRCLANSCKRGEISGAVWKKVQRRTNSLRAEKRAFSRRSFRNSLQGGNPPFLNLISPEIHDRRRRISSGVSFRDLGKVFFFYAGCTARNTSRWTESQVGLSGSWFCRNVAWRETQVLSTGSQ